MLFQITPLLERTSQSEQQDMESVETPSSAPTEGEEEVLMEFLGRWEIESERKKRGLGFDQMGRGD